MSPPQTMRKLSKKPNNIPNIQKGKNDTNLGIILMNLFLSKVVTCTVCSHYVATVFQI